VLLLKVIDEFEVFRSKISTFWAGVILWARAILDANLAIFSDLFKKSVIAQPDSWAVTAMLSKNMASFLVIIVVLSEIGEIMSPKCGFVNSHLLFWQFWGVIYLCLYQSLSWVHILTESRNLL